MNLTSNHMSILVIDQVPKNLEINLNAHAYRLYFFKELLLTCDQGSLVVYHGFFKKQLFKNFFELFAGSKCLVHFNKGSQPV